MERRGILRATAWIGFFTLLSRILGMVREILMAVFFGTSLAKSAFDVAFRIPNLFRRLFGEGALSAAFVPIFTGLLEKKDIEGARKLASGVATALAAVLAGIVMLGMVAITAVVDVCPLSERMALLLPLLRILLPYVFFICLAALFMGILNSTHRYVVPAAAPLILNLGWIVALFICPWFGDTALERIYVVAWGVLVSGLLQFLVQIPSLMRVGLLPRLTAGWRDEQLLRIVKLMGPAALGMGVFQINVCVDAMLALAVADWAPAALTYAERLIYLPLGVFGTALGTVLLPTFSRQVSAARSDELRRTLEESIVAVVLFMIPIAVGITLLAQPIVHLTYVWKNGQFGAEETLRTARALAWYAPGLFVFTLSKVLVPVFYANQDTITPIRVAIRSVGLNLFLNIVFVLTWPAGYKHAGIAFATVLASAVNCWMLCRIINQRVGGIRWRRLLRYGVQAVLVSLVAGVCALLTLRAANTVCLTVACPPKFAELLSLSFGALVAAVVYVACAFLFWKEESVRAYGRIAARRRRKQQAG